MKSGKHDFRSARELPILSKQRIKDILEETEDQNYLRSLELLEMDELEHTLKTISDSMMDDYDKYSREIIYLSK